MIKSMIDAIQHSLPLRIKAAKWEDPVLHLHGADWNFNTTSAWRLTSGRIVLVGCADTSASEKAEAIVGAMIIGVKVQSAHIAVDPVFQLSNGIQIEIFSTDIVEPWTMRLPTGEIFVASPSDKDAFL